MLTRRAVFRTGLFVIPVMLSLNLALHPPAYAQLRRCVPPAGNGLTIFLDDITTKEGSNPSQLLKPLISQLDRNLRQVQADTGLQLRFQRCEDRRPRSVSDFGSAVLRDLDAYKVVLEVWGDACEVNTGGKPPYHLATITYLLVPIQVSHPAAAIGAVSVTKKTENLGDPDEVYALLDRAGFLAAYAAVSAATRLRGEQEYDAARAQACKARGLLEVLGPEPLTPDEALLRYAKDLAGEITREARQSAYYKGPLKALPEEALGSCGGGQ